MNNKKINKVISTLISSGIINKTNIWIKAAKHLQMLLIAVPIFITSLKKVFDQAMKKKRLYGLIAKEDKWFHIGTVRDLKTAEELI